MWKLLAALLLAGSLGAPRAEATVAFAVCMGPGEMRETVAGAQVVAPASAVVTARRAMPGAEVVRANLCQGGEGLVYLISALHRDGRLVQVAIDARTGRILWGP